MLNALGPLGSLREFHKSYHGSKYTHMPLVRVPHSARVTKAMIERKAKSISSGGLTEEQFRRTRQPFDFPVLTKLPVADRKPSPAYLLQQLKAEEATRLAAGPRDIADFKVGDKVAVTQLVSLFEDKLEVIKGLVIEKRKKEHLDASFTIRNSSVGVSYELSIPLYSPFLRKVTIIEKGKGIRRAKLFFLSRLPQKDRRNRPIV